MVKGIPIAHKTHRRISRAFGLSQVVALLVLSILLSGGCAYFNTFYHAKKAFNEGESARKSMLQPNSAISAGKVSYERAIEKANKIVEKHPKSKYHDDALFVIGVSYFRINNFTKSEAAFRELLALHPKSDLAEESQLYLARCRIELGDEVDGFHTFSALAETGRKKEWRAEATFQRGEHFFRNAMYDSAAVAYERVFTEFKDGEREVESRQKGADALRHLGQYDSAITLYSSLIEHKQPEIRFQALRGMGEALYEAKRVDSGIAIFSSMTEKEEYADSLGSVRLDLARGLDESGDADAAWRQYEQVAALFEKTKWSAEALFRMAEIKQFREKDLVRARELYEKSRLESAVGSMSQLALTRSANITKLEQFRKELGRGQLNPSEQSRAAGELYDPARLPRLERLLTYSPREARPPGYEPPPPPDTTKPVFGPETPREIVIADSLARIVKDTLGPATPAWADSVRLALTLQGPPSSLIPFLGPPFSAADLAYNQRISELLPDAVWQSLAPVEPVYGPPSPVTRAYGPPSPAYLYEFGTGNLLGPPTPLDTIAPSLVETSPDSVEALERVERDSLRAARMSELDKVKSAANTQMQLAELYRFDLGYPDSALTEYDKLVERYPGTPYAAKALLGAGDVLMESLGDTVAAKARLHRILEEYPYSDYAGDAIVRLHLEGTPADTAHPRLAYQKIERALEERRTGKHTLEQLEQFIDRYPESRLVPNAEFAIAELRERHLAAEDSSVVYAYKAITTKYPNTPFAIAATEKLTTTVKRPPKRAAPKILDSTAAAGPKLASADADSAAKKSALPKAPTKIKRKGEFIYPESEISKGWKGKVVYRIEIDYSGQISRYELLGKSPYPAIDEAARQAVEQTSFFFDSIPPESLNMPYLYEIDVMPPAQAVDPLNLMGVPAFDPNKP